jgi:H+/gluconate symporter-like permease
MDPLWLLIIGMAVVVGGIVGRRLDGFLALVLAAIVVGSLRPKVSLEQYARAKMLSAVETTNPLGQSSGERVTGQFGNTCARIGVLIALGSIIGRILLENVGAERIVRTAMRRLDKRRAPPRWRCSPQSGFSAEWSIAQSMASILSPSRAPSRCRSKPFPWMNASGFWLANRRAGLTIGSTVKACSFLQCVMSLAGLATLLCCCW